MDQLKPEEKQDETGTECDWQLKTKRTQLWLTSDGLFLTKRLMFLVNSNLPNLKICQLQFALFEVYCLLLFGIQAIPMTMFKNTGIQILFGVTAISFQKKKR